MSLRHENRMLVQPDVPTCGEEHRSQNRGSEPYSFSSVDVGHTNKNTHAYAINRVMPLRQFQRMLVWLDALSNREVNG